MDRKRFLAWTGLAVAGPIALTFALLTGADATSTSPVPDDDGLFDESKSLNCGTGKVMVYRATYVPKDADQQKANPPALTPEQAMARFTGRVYPEAAATRAFEKVPGLPEGLRPRFEASSPRGGKGAVIVIGERQREYFIEEVAICDELAREWAK